MSIRAIKAIKSGGYGVRCLQEYVATGPRAA
jgi:hypothetical protein